MIALFRSTLLTSALCIMSYMVFGQRCPSGCTQFIFEPGQQVQVIACKQNEVSLGKQSVFWGVKNLTNKKLYVKFDKVVTTTCGKVLRSKGDTYLEPGEFKGGTTFSGEITFETQVWGEDCAAKGNRISRIAYENLTTKISD